MTASKRLNLWMASTTLERNGQGTDDGVTVGDFCLVDGANLYVATTVAAASSTWEPMAGVPTTGWYAMGGKNSADTLNRAVFAMNAASFRAVLDGTPSSVTLSAGSNFNWPILPNVQQLDRFGFQYSGTSSIVGPNTNTWRRGQYTISY